MTTLDIGFTEEPEMEKAGVRGPALGMGSWVHVQGQSPLIKVRVNPRKLCEALRPLDLQTPFPPPGIFYLHHWLLSIILAHMSHSLREEPL